VTLVRKAVRGALWTIASGVCSRAIGLVGTLVVARFVAPAEYGEVTVAAVLVMTANQMTSIGLGQFLVARPDSPRSVAFHVTLLHGALGVLAAVAVLGGAGKFGSMLDAPGMARFLPGLVLSGLIDRTAYVPERILVRDLRFGAVSAARTAGDLAYTGVCVWLAVAGWGAAALVMANILRSLLRAACFVFAVDVRDWIEPSRPSLDTTRKLLGFGVPLSVGGIFAFASRRWDNLLVSRFFGPGPTGMYNLAYNLADVPAIQIGEQIGDVLVPSFARLEPARRPDALIRSIGLLSLVVFPLAIGLGAVAPTLVAAIFDARWRPLAPMLVLLSSLSVARPIGWIVASYLQALGHTRRILWLEGFKLMALVTLIVTVGRIGPLVTCGAVGAAFGAHALAALWVVRKIDGVPIGRLLAGPFAALSACVPLVAGVLAMRHLLASTGGVDKPIVLLGAEVFAGAVCYVLAATLIARTTSLDLVARVADAVRARA
jgi:PST family polysaccharide transporter